MPWKDLAPTSNICQEIFGDRAKNIIKEELAKLGKRN
jgi:hypothetical protein